MSVSSRSCRRFSPIKLCVGGLGVVRFLNKSIGSGSAMCTEVSLVGGAKARLEVMVTSEGVVGNGTNSGDCKSGNWNETETNALE